MHLTDILGELGKVMEFDGCLDPLHSLRGVCAKGVKTGWLTRVERGYFALAPKNATGPEPKRRSRKGVSSRRGRSKGLQISIGDIVLETPSQMRADSVAKIIKAIREIQ